MRIQITLFFHDHLYLRAHHLYDFPQEWEANLDNYCITYYQPSIKMEHLQQRDSGLKATFLKSDSKVNWNQFRKKFRKNQVKIEYLNLKSPNYFSYFLHVKNN